MKPHPLRFRPFPSLTTKEEESVIYKNICTLCYCK